MARRNLDCFALFYGLLGILHLLGKRIQPGGICREFLNLVFHQVEGRKMAHAKHIQAHRFPSIQRIGNFHQVKFNAVLLRINRRRAVLFGNANIFQFAIIRRIKCVVVGGTCAKNHHQSKENPFFHISTPHLLKEIDQRKIQGQQIDLEIHDIVQNFAARLSVFFDFHKRRTQTQKTHRGFKGQAVKHHNA